MSRSPWLPRAVAGCGCLELDGGDDPGAGEMLDEERRHVSVRPALAAARMLTMYQMLCYSLHMEQKLGGKLVYEIGPAVKR